MRLLKFPAKRLEAEDLMDSNVALTAKPVSRGGLPLGRRGRISASPHSSSLEPMASAPINESYQESISLLI